MFVYLLECIDNSTYVGATVDVNRRLRQHNKEIKGGAHATGVKVAAGKSWTRVCYVSGFPIGQPHCNLNGVGNNYRGSYRIACFHWNDECKRYKTY